MDINELIKDIQEYISTRREHIILCGSAGNDEEITIGISVEGQLREINLSLSDNTNEEAFNKVKDMINA